MKKNLLVIMILCMALSVTGCAKYEKDRSYNDTEIYGNYGKRTINEDNTYTMGDRSGNILSVNKLTDDITEIEWRYNDEDSSLTIDKYKNMLGIFCRCEVPSGRRFYLKPDTGSWYAKDGQHHLCFGNDDCDCVSYAPKYRRKGDIIYLEREDSYEILAYIVDEGLFYPTEYKTK